jgi:hypothetical protein
MKMSPEHYAKIEAAMKAKLAEKPDAWATYKAAGLSPMRFRWDLMRAAKVDTGFLYKAGLNDDHIDTALRKICKPYMN